MPVMADPTQLEVAILNLAINARDAMPDGGMLTFSTRPVHVGGDGDLEHGDYIELTISDTGTGMPPEVPSARSSRSSRPRRSARAPGSACRWSMAWRASRAAPRGSTARPARAPRSGCCSARRPRPSPTPPRRRRAAAPEAAAEPLSILVIDDDPDVRDFIAAALEEQGYGVRHAGDGRDGVASSSATPRPGHRRLHHARPVGRRSRAKNPRRRCRTSRSCSSRATARPTRSSAPRPTRRCWPSRSAPTRCRRQSDAALSPPALNPTRPRALSAARVGRLA